MRSELQLLFAPFGLVRSDQRDPEVFWGSAGRCEVVAALTGIGMNAGAKCATAIAGVCEQRGCPWSVFRAVSDRADDGTTDAAVLALVDQDGSPNLAAVARFILKRPHRIPQLVRLGRGAKSAARAAAGAAAAALESC